MPSPIDVVLPRLAGVKATGKRKWMARCPTRADKTPSLSIRELDNGRVLLHDFGGERTTNVLAAIGLNVADLYPGSKQHSTRRSPSRAAIEHEQHIVALGLSLLAQGVNLSPSDLSRLETARRRLEMLGVRG